MSGVVLVNGSPLRRPGHAVDARARLDAAVDERRLATGSEPGRAIDVLFEDAALIAVAKPAGLAVHATADPARADLFTLVRRHLAAREGASAPLAPLPYLGLHHRLDRETSGIVVFTKQAAANAGLARQFAERGVEKVYHALTRRPAGAVDRSWHVSNRLSQAGTGRRSRVEGVAAGGAEAETMFAVLERFSSALLVEARPLTGRKHQIRAHLSPGCAILGDVRYGGPERVGHTHVPRVMLHARLLRLRHPITGAPLEIACEYPDDFREILALLRSGETNRG